MSLGKFQYFLHLSTLDAAKGVRAWEESTGSGCCMEEQKGPHLQLYSSTGERIPGSRESQGLPLLAWAKRSSRHFSELASLYIFIYCQVYEVIFKSRAIWSQISWTHNKSYILSSLMTEKLEHLLTISPFCAMWLFVPLKSGEQGSTQLSFETDQLFLHQEKQAGMSSWWYCFPLVKRQSV